MRSIDFTKLSNGKCRIVGYELKQVLILTGRGSQKGLSPREMSY